MKNLNNFVDQLNTLNKYEASFRFWNGAMFGCNVGQWCTTDKEVEFMIVTGFWLLSLVMGLVRMHQWNKAYKSLEKSVED